MLAAPAAAAAWLARYLRFGNIPKTTHVAHTTSSVAHKLFSISSRSKVYLIFFVGPYESADSYEELFLAVIDGVELGATAS
jgi:hypothetical protein